MTNSEILDENYILAHELSLGTKPSKGDQTMTISIEPLSVKQEILVNGKVHHRTTVGRNDPTWSKWNPKHREYQVLTDEEQEELEAKYQKTKERIDKLWLD